MILPTFQGDTLYDDSYLEEIELDFKPAAMVDFTHDKNRCNNHFTWSLALASNLRESLKSSSILNFLADDQDADENCEVVFNAVEEHLTTRDVTIEWILPTGKVFLLLSAYRGKSLTFYSKSKGILHHLKRGNMVAVTNEVFPKTYFSMTIDTPELQSEVTKFLKEPASSYSETLEAIHLDYRAQTTGKESSKHGVSTLTSTLSRGKAEE